MQAFEGFDAFAEIGGRLERCYLASSNDNALFIFYFDNPGLANEEEILGVIEKTRGNDIHTEPVLDDGTKIYVSTMPSGDSQNVLIFEIVDGEGFYLAALFIDSAEPHDGIDRISFTDGSELSGYLAGDPGDASAGSMRIGSDRNGYLEVPSTWMIFKDMGDVDPDMIQYSDGGGSIVSMLGIILRGGLQRQRRRLCPVVCRGPLRGPRWGSGCRRAGFVYADARMRSRFLHRGN